MHFISSIPFNSYFGCFNPLIDQALEQPVSLPLPIQDLVNGPLVREEWQTAFYQYCRQISLDQLTDLLNQHLFPLIEHYDLEGLKQSCQIPDVALHAFQQEIEVPIASADQLFNTNKSAQSSCSPLYFFHNFMEHLLSALNFFDSKDPPANTHEKHAVIQIYYRFFQIPFAIAFILQPLLIIAWKVYLVTLAILGGISLGLYVYKRWLRPFPQNIPCSQDIEEIVAKKFVSPIRGLDEEVAELSLRFSSQSEKKPIMIVAPTRAGKTTLFYKLYQKIKQGEVCEALKGKRLVFLQGSDIVVKSNASFGNKINDIRAKIRGFEKEVIVCVDEVQAIAKNAVCLASMKEFLRTPGIQFVTITTPESFREVVTAFDKDSSFSETFQYMTIRPWQKEQVMSLVEERIYNTAADILFENDAIDAIIELTKDQSSDRYQLNKAFQLLELVINANRANLEYSPIEGLAEKKMELEGLKKYRRARQYPSLLVQKDQERVRTLEMEIRQHEETQENNRKQGTHLKKLIQLRSGLKEDSLKSCVELAQFHQNQEIADIFLQKKYLLLNFYVIPVLDRLIEDQRANIGSTLDVQVDAHFVEKIFEQYQSFERRLRGMDEQAL